MSKAPHGLNESAFILAEEMIAASDHLKIETHEIPGGGRVIDAGVDVKGTLDAGLRLATICMAGLGTVTARTEGPAGTRTTTISTQTDAPIAACLASQYAGWRIVVEDYFAMGSGPMRAAYAGEDLYEIIGFTETPSRVVGVLESDGLPGRDVIEFIRDKTGVAPENVILAVAATNSVAGSVQVVARSVETALHKLHMLDFELERIIGGQGAAPLPPLAADSLTALGRVNDAMLYGARVSLNVRGDDAYLRDIGPRVPSSSSADHGTPFGEIFDRYDRDFYKIDPHLFSPAEVTFVNVETGKSFTFGAVAPDVLERSFAD